jgi:hypothetical protein
VPAFGCHPAAVSDATPLSILGTDLLQWVRADLGITIGTGVSAWADQSGNGLHYAQASSTLQPTFGATDGPNGTPALTFDGSNDFLDAAGFSLPAPGTQPYFVAMIVQMLAWGSNRRFVADGVSASCSIIMAPSTPSVGQRCGTTINGNTNLAVGGAAMLAVARFSNSAADYFRIGSVTVTGGGSAGNTAGGTSRQIATTGGGASGCANIRVAELFYGKGDYATNGAALDAYFAARYGSGVLA